MTRYQRRLHLWVWLLLGPMTAAALALAVVFRRPVPVQELPAIMQSGATQNLPAVPGGGAP